MHGVGGEYTSYIYAQPLSYPIHYLRKVVHPFNTVAIRMNLATMAAGANGPSLSFGSYLSNMVKTQGVMSLYSGLSAGLLRQCFYATSRVGFFEVLRDEMAKYRPTDFLSRLVVGVVSGGMAAVISCPAEGMLHI